jgi:hypothetical protein
MAFALVNNELKINCIFSNTPTPADSRRLLSPTTFTGKNKTNGASHPSISLRERVSFRGRSVDSVRSGTGGFFTAGRCDVFYLAETRILIGFSTLVTTVTGGTGSKGGMGEERMNSRFLWEKCY